MIRAATLADLEPLLALERQSFSSDQISRRSFRHFLTRAHAQLRVYEDAEGVGGYALVLFHRGTVLARLYSLAVAGRLRGQGRGAALLQAAEQAAHEEGCLTIRLEVRSHNDAAIALYERAGYQRFALLPGYYEDASDALRFEKRLREPDVISRDCPYYAQTLDFTCGPAALMMAMQAISPSLALNRKLELRLWREATSIFMTSGHGGCGPYGLALAASRRGFTVEVFVRDAATLFVDSVRSEEKKTVIRLVQEDMLAELVELAVPVHHRRLPAAELGERLAAGQMAVVLISSWRIYREKFPHWVVVTGCSRDYVWVHDPYVDYEQDKRPVDCIDLPILRPEFERMSRYGKSGQRAIVLISR